MLDDLPPREPYHGQHGWALGRWFWFRECGTEKHWRIPSELPPELYDRMRRNYPYHTETAIYYDTRQEAIDHLEATIKSLPANYQETPTS